MSQPRLQQLSTWLLKSEANSIGPSFPSLPLCGNQPWWSYSNPSLTSSNQTLAWQQYFHNTPREFCKLPKPGAWTRRSTALDVLIQAAGISSWDWNQAWPQTTSHQRPRITKDIQAHWAISRLCLAAQLLQKRRLQKPIGQPIAEDIPNQHLFPYFHSHQPNSPKKFGCKQFGLLPISSYLDAPGGILAPRAKKSLEIKVLWI